MIPLSYPSLLTHISQLALFVLSPLATAKFWLRAKQKPQLLIFQFTISLFNKKFVLLSKTFDDVISCDVWFSPPTINNPGYAYVPSPAFFKLNVKNGLYVKQLEISLKSVIKCLAFFNFLTKNFDKKRVRMYYRQCIYCHRPYTVLFPIFFVR